MTEKKEGVEATVRTIRRVTQKKYSADGLAKERRRKGGTPLTSPTDPRPSQDLVKDLRRRARNIRISILAMFHAAGGGHFGGCLSIADILAVLYFHVLRVDPLNPFWEDRDRFVLSKGHGTAALIATLAEAGFFHPSALSTFNQFDSNFSTHADRFKLPGCEMSCGSLGHGFPVAGGMALAAKRTRKPYRVFTLIGDGENMEGSVWEAAMACAHYELDNLTCIVDRNRMMLDGPTEELMALEPLAEKWRAFGWTVREIDGHSIPSLIEALRCVPWQPDRPSLLIASTTKGKGVPFMETDMLWHYRGISEGEYRQAMDALGVED